MVGQNLNYINAATKKNGSELFKPFLYARLDKLGLATAIKQAKRLVEKEKSEVWDRTHYKEHPILLNERQLLQVGCPTFETKLIENAIELHPLVCAAFNADLTRPNGGTYPLSLEAQLEARVL